MVGRLAMRGNDVEMSGKLVGDDGLRRGIELFNRREFFEAHEVLEEVWRETRAQTRRGHLQGLVQLAVALHHESRGNLAGARSVLERALRNLVNAEDSFPEIDWAGLFAGGEEWRRYLAGAAPRPELPRLYLRGGVIEHPARISGE